VERALKDHQAQSNLSRAIQQPNRPTEGDRRMSTDGITSTRLRAVVETIGDESERRSRSFHTSPVVQSDGLMRPQKRTHDLGWSTHIPTDGVLDDPDLVIQAESSTGDMFVDLQRPEPRKRRRNARFDTEDYSARNANRGPSNESSIDIKQLLEAYGGLLERSAPNWLAHPEEFFKLDDIISTLDEVVGRAFDKALCIFDVAGSSKNHSKMIQVVTAYTFQQEYGRKHMSGSRLKHLRQCGNKFSSLVEIFECKSILLLMPCTRYVGIAMHWSDLLTPDSLVFSG
jgi:hypothetical protein